MKLVESQELLWVCFELGFLCVLQVDNEDVLHAVVALYDVSLPDIGARDILHTVYCQGAHTIVLLRQPKGTVLS